MASDLDLIDGLRQFLRTADLSTTTTAIVRRRLEEEFDVDLTNKKAFIREQVNLFLQSLQENDNPEQENDGGGTSKSEEEEEEDSDGEENGEGDSTGGSRRKAVANVKKNGGGGFTKLCGLSPKLQKVLGVSKLPRTKVVQQIWVYIREHDLQDPENRRNIRCDKLLHSIFDTDSVNMFQMNKLLSKHIFSLSPEEGNDESVTEKKPAKSETSLKEKRRDEPKLKAKKRLKKEKDESGNGRSSGLLAPLPLSDALVKFLGTGEDTLPRSEVVKRIWAYIKENELQDPSDKRRIICDEKLKALLDVDSFTGFTVSKLLSAHFVKAEH